MVIFIKYNHYLNKNQVLMVIGKSIMLLMKANAAHKISLIAQWWFKQMVN
jgi:hypothetical protein